MKLKIPMELSIIEVLALNTLCESNSLSQLLGLTLQRGVTCIELRLPQSSQKLLVAQSAKTLNFLKKKKKLKNQTFSEQ